MYRSRSRLTRLGVWAAAFALLLSFAPGPLWADIVTTGQWLEQEQGETDRTALAAQRAYLQQRLVSWGVDPGLAAERVARLTPAEVHELAQRADEMPAGAGVVNAVVFVFLVLLITDILGVTDIFPFVRSPGDDYAFSDSFVP